MSQAGTYFFGTRNPEIETLTGNTGGPVPADNNFNINVVGTDPITVTGSPGSSTLTITVEEATENQIGVVIYGNDTDAIAGVLDNVTVHPQALQAKIGNQTEFGLAYGAGSGTAIQWTPAGQTGQVLAGVDSATPTWLGPANDGEVLIGNSGGQIAWSTLTAGSNVTITEGANQIVISSTGGGGGSTVGFQEVVFDSGVVIDDGSHIYELLGGANITTAGDGAQTAQVTLNDNVTIIGNYRTVGGNFKLPATDSGLTQGVIEWNNVPFIHTTNDNFFAGHNAATSGAIIGVDNVGIGQDALQNLTSGDNNIALGTALDSLETSDNNVAIGHLALSSLTSGVGQNIAIGSSAGQSLETGVDNIILGVASGSAYTSSESDNICIGNPGATLDQNIMRLGKDGTGSGEVDETYVAGVYQRLPSSSSEVVYIDSNHQMSTPGPSLDGQVLIGASGSSASWNNITAGSGINVTNGPNSISISSTFSGGVKVSEFSTTGTHTWTKDPNAALISVIGWSGGGGGSSGGGNTTDAPPRTGVAGQGGAGASVIIYDNIPAKFFGATETVIVGVGGAGGAGAAGFNSAAGSAGGATSIGDLTTRTASGGQGASRNLRQSGMTYSFHTSSSYLNATGANSIDVSNVSDAASAPRTTTGTKDGVKAPSDIGSSGATGANDGQPGNRFGRLPGATSGGSGGQNTTLSITTPQDGGSLYDNLNNLLQSGGTAGTTGSPDGNIGAARTLFSGGIMRGGLGGGGGYRETSSNFAGDGGTGGFPGGGGGGGGGAFAGNKGGDGGNGAQGLLIVIEFLA